MELAPPPRSGVELMMMMVMMMVMATTMTMTMTMMMMMVLMECLSKFLRCLYDALGFYWMSQLILRILS